MVRVKKGVWRVSGTQKVLWVRVYRRSQLFARLFVPSVTSGEQSAAKTRRDVGHTLFLHYTPANQTAFISNTRGGKENENSIFSSFIYKIYGF